MAEDRSWVLAGSGLPSCHVLVSALLSLSLPDVSLQQASSVLRMCAIVWMVPGETGRRRVESSLGGNAAVALSRSYSYCSAAVGVSQGSQR